MQKLDEKDYLLEILLSTNNKNYYNNESEDEDSVKFEIVKKNN